MKTRDWTAAIFLVILSAMAVGIGWEADQHATEIWTHIAAGISTGIGIIVLVATTVEVTHKSRTR